MKLLIIGDPHGDDRVFDIKVDKDIDGIIITGDLGKSDLIRKYHFEYNEKRGIRDWRKAIPKLILKSLYLELIMSSIKIIKYFGPKKPTFFVFGNLRDLKKSIAKEREKKYNLSLPIFEEKIKGVKGIKNISFKKIKFKGLEIAGIPFYESLDWVKRFSPKDGKREELANKEEPEAANFIKKLPKVDVLLTHIPPYGVLDKVSSSFVPESWKGKHAGSKLVLDYIKKKKPKLVICGHIHEAKGEKMIGQTRVINAGSNGDHLIIEI